ncbi:hypothetical protein B0J12DRAFT_660240 [Macrophomina phaseolina]|uniref:Uncharacterized protein n=1 Tax=Macrophomina phaseolina TaxID=35725 RepID=A0ABQ8GCE9_9PEZI|nr:hypothetical protein B0J12DRAFT_660240 [Macrophomina phaseolina]
MWTRLQFSILPQARAWLFATRTTTKMAPRSSVTRTASHWLIWSFLFSSSGARSLCGMLDPRTAILDNRLFWSSGNYTFSSTSASASSTTTTTWTNTTSLYWLRLTDTTAPLDVHGPISTDLIHSVLLPSDALPAARPRSPAAAPPAPSSPRDDRGRAHRVREQQRGGVRAPTPARGRRGTRAGGRWPSTGRIMGR